MSSSLEYREVKILMLCVNRQDPRQIMWQPYPCCIAGFRLNEEPSFAQGSDRRC